MSFSIHDHRAESSKYRHATWINTKSREADTKGMRYDYSNCNELTPQMEIAGFLNLTLIYSRKLVSCLWRANKSKVTSWRKGNSTCHLFGANLRMYTYPHNLSLKVNFLFRRKLLADAIATAHSKDIAYCNPFSTNT